MPTNFPNNLDSMRDPLGTDSLFDHAQQHGNENDAIEAIQTKLGIDNSTVVTSLDHLVKASTDPGHTHSVIAVETARATAAEGQRWNTRGVWTGPGTNFSVNDVVDGPTGFTGGVYRCIAAHTSGASFSGPGANWEVVRDANGTFASLAAAPNGPVLTAMPGTHNEAVGAGALSAITTGGLSTAMGYQALQSVTTSNNNSAFGYQALQAATGPDNTAVGIAALRAQTTASANTAVGSSAGTAVTTGSNLALVGYQAGSALTTGATTVAFGALALSQNQTGTDNVAIGYGAYSEGQGSQNVCIGREALSNRNTATNCTALGWEAMGWGKGDSNTAVGAQAMFGANDQVHLTGAGTVLTAGVAVTSLPVQATPYAVSDGDSITVTYLGNSDTFTVSGNQAAGITAITVLSHAPTHSYTSQAVVTDTGPGHVWANTFTRCTAVGTFALKAVSSGSDNTAVGYEALFGAAANTAAFSTAIGSQALQVVTTGSNNTALGYFAGNQVTTGSNNTLLGFEAGYTQTPSHASSVGSNQTHVGAQAGNAFFLAGGINNNVAVGYRALVGTNGTAVGQGALATGDSTGNSQVALGYLASASASGGKGNMALGANTNASAGGAVAIGCDSAGTGASCATADTIQLGTALHSTRLGFGAPGLTATTGYPYIPADAGAPTGVPTAQTGYVAVKYDSTNRKLWIYDAGWKGVVVA